MAVIDSVLNEELSRLLALRARYAAERQALIRGSIIMKKKSGHNYAYRAYRKGNRVVTDYVGREASPQARKLAATIEKRRRIIRQIRALDADAARLRKMINAK